MENSTVAFSVIQDLIHWPLPPSDPSVNNFGETHAGSSVGSLAFSDDQSFNELPLTAGATEELDEEPPERQQARYAAVRRLMALSLAMGEEWARQEVVPYLLRCLEEEDAELSFSVGLTVMDFGSLRTSSSSPLTIRDLIPVVARMGESADSGVRHFLVEVVIPTLFFGVSLECSVDLREWRAKYVKTPRCSNDFSEASDELGFGRTSKQGDSTRCGVNGRFEGSRINDRNDIHCAAGTSNDVWDPFQINLHASKLRGAITDYLNNVCKYASERAEEPGVTASLIARSSALDPSNYSGNRERCDAFHHRWTMFLGLMETMLRSRYVAAVAAAVQCVSNVFASITWAMRVDENNRGVSTSTLMNSVEELVEFTFVATRTHVGRSILSCTQEPCKELMQLLVEAQVFVSGGGGSPIAKVESAKNVSDSGDTKSGKAANAVVDDGSGRHTIQLGLAGCTASQRDVWDACLTAADAKRMPNVLFVSILRSLPLLLDWSNASNPKMATAYEAGLCFLTVCNIFRHAITPLVPHQDGGNYDGVSPEGGIRGGNKSRGNFSRSVKKEVSAPQPFIGNAALMLESAACRDFTVSEAVLDGLQQLLDELQRPHAIEDFLRDGTSSARLTLREKISLLRQLCSLYRDCVVHLASAPSWKTRWLVTQRLPELTGSIIMLLCRIGCHHPIDGPSLVEECVVYLCRLHTELWAGPKEGDGELQEMAQDEEEEVRCVIGVCAARVFTAIGQGMVRLTFPGGLVKDLRVKNADKNRPDMGTAAGNYYNDPISPGVHYKSSSAKESISSCNTGPNEVLLATSTVTKNLPQLFDVVFACCAGLLQDKEERVRSGAAAALSVLSRTLSTMVTVCEFNPRGVPKADWLDCLNRTTSLLMELLGDCSPIVQLSLVSELVALLSTRTAGAGKLAAIMGSYGNGKALELREGALTACLNRLSKHEIWRYRAEYATLLAEMCLRFLAPNSLAAAELDVSRTPRSVHLLEIGLRESRNVESARKPCGAVFAEDGVDPLHCFAKEELLPLLVDVLFDKVKAVRDSALESLVHMCERLSAARRLLKQELSPSSDELRCSRGRDILTGAMREVGRGGPLHGSGTGGLLRKKQSLCSRFCYDNEDDVFISDTLWPLIVNSPKAMATYLSRSSLLRIAVRIGVDKRSILLPLFDQLGHDPVLNVRLVVAKELYGILEISPGVAASGGSTGSNALPKTFFTEKEKNGVVLDLLRLLVEDKSADVRDEAAKALKLCF
ncbi:uncharacterized protein TEOVI_000628300 [Trypanosoma equiperdum]|uniref:HEAT repeat n=1 Tax=Trypanosoma equiperdum TaxID=5694 RepID=A0A1G4IAB0_TRYEQ|nr:hypothetical protein, conserved [Trypanosoma equiperdum]